MADRVILATAPLRGPGLDALRELGEVVLDPWIDQRPLRLYSAEQLAARAAEVGATVLICEADRCAGPVLDLPLEAIGATRGDPTNVDVPAATAAGIPVLRAPGRNADAVAELTVGLLLAATRGLVAADRDVRAGEVYRDGTIPYQRFRAWQLAGRTAGLVGLGAVGRATRWRLEGLGMRVIASDPYAGGATHDLDDLLAEADVVSMHAAVTPDTVGLMSDEALRRPARRAPCTSTPPGPPSTTSTPSPRPWRRGTWPPPASTTSRARCWPPTIPLVGMPNVVLTPHIGGATYDTEANHTALMAEGLAALLRGEAPANLVNPEVLARG